jgi:hypothetical protein
MAATPKQPTDEIDISEHWFVPFFVRVLLVSAVLTAILLWVAIKLAINPQ